MAVDLTDRASTVEELSDYEKRRFLKNDVCPICSKKITTYQSFIMFKRKNGKSMRYSFYHEECLYVGRNDLYE